MKDLHIHTKYSDGEFDENEILEKIKKAKLSEFAICDHDTIEGSQKVKELLIENGENIVFHSGVELTSRLNFLNGFNIHLLAYDFDYDNENIIFLIDKISNLRLQKVSRMADLIKEAFNFEIPQKDITETLKTTNSFGKPHMFTILSKYISVDRKIFYSTMNNLHSEDLKLDANEVIEKVHNAGGKVVLAHLIEVVKEYDLNNQQLEEIIANLKNLGLDGLETKHSSHTKENSHLYSSLAKKYGLFETSGSDYHGPFVKPDIEIGNCEKIDN